MEILTKPLQDVTASDVQRLIDRKAPETDQLEFKGEPPWKSGQPKWPDEFHSYARDEILQELVAFANTAGGVVAVGVAESDTKPKRAESPSPIERCSDFVERILRAGADLIEPTMDIEAVGVPIEGDRGYAVFRVRKSPTRPHRLRDRSKRRECYVRRGENTCQMSMREIREMTIASMIEMSWFEDRFSRLDGDYWRFIDKISEPDLFEDNVPGYSIFRILVCPILQPLDIGNVFRSRNIAPKFKTRKIQFGSDLSDSSHVSPIQNFHRRAILRGCRWGTEESFDQIEIFSDGAIRYVQKSSQQRKDGMFVADACIVRALANVLDTVASVKEQSGLSLTEYALELQVGTTLGVPAILVGQATYTEAAKRSQLSDGLIKLPRISVGSTDSFNEAINSIFTDLWNDAGDDLPYEYKVMDFVAVEGSMD